uniref:Uncharacterized protein n=1 Tax=Sphaerodactylus townsendi TaxID=933632 RepID=A0ACB8EUF1_9SAUR
MGAMVTMGPKVQMAGQSRMSSRALERGPQKVGSYMMRDEFDTDVEQVSEAQSELMNSGLYLVLLLHLYEQRFAELMRLNYNQASRDRLSRQPRTEENQMAAIL